MAPKVTETAGDDLDQERATLKMLQEDLKLQIKVLQAELRDVQTRLKQLPKAPPGRRWTHYVPKPGSVAADLERAARIGIQLIHKWQHDQRQLGKSDRLPSERREEIIERMHALFPQAKKRSIRSKIARYRSYNPERPGRPVQRYRAPDWYDGVDERLVPHNPGASK
ncbi:hypothetical protein [Bradyrhizobium centrosematis]|uniref:hypothetical protein n=1 Tax=Bradyrhizobium centrosematis TaxID=1300039 RepID=UPI00388E5CD3